MDLSGKEIGYGDGSSEEDDMPREVAEERYESGEKMPMTTEIHSPSKYNHGKFT